MSPLAQKPLPRDKRECMSHVPSSLRWSTMVAAVEPVTAPEEMPRTSSKTWLITSSGVSVTVVPIGKIGAAAETSAAVTSGGHAIGRVTAAMAVGVDGGVVLPKSILLIDAGVGVAVVGGGPVRTSGGAVPRPAMREERLGEKTWTILVPRLLLGAAGSAERPGVRSSAIRDPSRLLVLGVGTAAVSIHGVMRRERTC
jgi:hypothetical protein